MSSSTLSTSTLEDQLKAYFGYNAFRHNQKEIVTNILANKDVLAILPTGAGKSICYQLPALLMPGIAVVISPLISLMQDQVISLTKNGIPAAYLNSSLHPQDARWILNNLSDYKLLYVAPERLADENLINCLKDTTVSFFAIDEAHCISQWGHSFRPEYRQLAALKNSFPHSAMVALTATATKEVEQDISSQLAMKEPFIIRASFDRPNLTLLIANKSHPANQLREFIEKHPHQAGIIYASTRKNVDTIFDDLQSQGLIVGKYHAGLTEQERTKAQHDFVYGQVNLMVATVAFGMGIHKPDIRYIIHHDMPRNIEQYYQEIGRAGRDGLPADCLLLFSVQDLMIYQSFLKNISDELLKSVTKIKTDRMYAFCRSSSCRRRDILKYFSENYPQTNCNSCDNCLDTTEMVDELINAQKILSCVARVQQRFGIKHVIDVLRGSGNKSIVEKNHDQLSTYGIMKDYSDEEIRYLIDGLIDLGYLVRSEGEYPVLQWTDTSPQVIQSKVRVLLRKRARTLSVSKNAQGLHYDQALFNELAKLRIKWAQDTKVPTFVVFGDRTLIEMATKYPVTEEAMLAINGVGPSKWEKYGSSFKDLIASYCLRNNMTPSQTKIKIPSLSETPQPDNRMRVKSAKDSVELFLKGHTVEQIAVLRQLSRLTIIDHLAEQIQAGKAIDISSIVPLEKQAAIKEVITNLGVEKLAPIKLALPDHYTYEEIRLVVAFYRRDVM